MCHLAGLYSSSWLLGRPSWVLGGGVQSTGRGTGPPGEGVQSAGWEQGRPSAGQGTGPGRGTGWGTGWGTGPGWGKEFKFFEFSNLSGTYFVSKFSPYGQMARAKHSVYLE